MHVPVAVLNRLRSEGFDWQVPGLREDLAVALLKSLPKATRRHFVPTPDHATAALAEADPARAVAHRRAGPRAPRAHRRPHPAGGVGRRPRARPPADHLQRRGPAAAGHRPGQGPRGAARAGRRSACARAWRGRRRPSSAAACTGWTVGAVPETFEGRAGGQTVVGFPALVDEGSSVGLRVLPDAGAAGAAHRRGVRRLLLLNTTAPWKRVLARLSNAQKLALADNPHGSVPALLQDCLDARGRRHRRRARARGGPVRGGLGRRARRRAHPRRDARARRSSRPSSRCSPGPPRSAGRSTPSPGAAADRTAATRADVRAQLDSLVRPGFVAATGVGRLRDVERYLRAMQHRLERAATNAREARPPGAGRRGRDRLRRPARVAARRCGAAPPTSPTSRWMIEELRVSLFAQTLGTVRPGVGEAGAHAAAIEASRPGP